MSLRLLLVAATLASLAAACDLRRFPLAPDGGAGKGGTGAGGKDAGMAGAGPGPVDARDGSSLSDTIPDAPQCTNGLTCTPTNPCHVGETLCGASGAASCTDTQRSQSNGTTCGSGMVCRDGACAPCAADTSCAVAGKPCRRGATSCMTGAAVCAEVDNQSNGMPCGSAMVCQEGQCVACQADAPCMPANPCRQGGLACASGTPQCVEKATPVSAGAPCGTNKVCDGAGACGACTASASCAVAGKPCRKGTTTCNTGAPVCAEAGNADEGMTCGTNMVCSGGACVACTAGIACTPANPCHNGLTSCAPITCTDTGTARGNGTTCGTNMVCLNGICGGCTPGASCQPANPCKAGATSCATGASVCAETGNKGNGTTCGANQVCSNGGCVPCGAGNACTPANPCHKGTLTCDTGAPVCTDNAMLISDGSSCGTNLVCKTGNCVSCVAGVTCTHANPCKYGVTSCSTGVSVCADAGNKPVATLCGAGQSCSAGVKTLAAACNGSAQCVAGTVGCTNGCNAGGTDCATCPPGQSSCPGGCANLTNDPANCGGCSFGCPAPPVAGSGSATCAAMKCGMACNAGYQICGSGAYCQVKSWGFEDGTTGGYSILRTDYTMAVTSISNSTSVAHSGTHSLAIAVNVAGGVRGFEVGLKMCGAGGSVASQGQTVSAWFYLQNGSGGQPDVDTNSYFGEHLYTEAFNGGSIPYHSATFTWFQVVTPIENLGTQLWQIALEAYFNGVTTWNGTVYVDDITIQ